MLNQQQIKFMTAQRLASWLECGVQDVEIHFTSPQTGWFLAKRFDFYAIGRFESKVYGDRFVVLNEADVSVVFTLDSLKESKQIFDKIKNPAPLAA